MPINSGYENDEPMQTKSRKEGEDEEEEEETESWPSPNKLHKILAISYRQGRLGAAVYDQPITTINLISDVSEDDELLIVRTLLNQVEPSTIIVNKNQDIKLLNLVAKACGMKAVVSKKEYTWNTSIATSKSNDTVAEVREITAENSREIQISIENNEITENDIVIEPDSNIERTDEDDPLPELFIMPSYSFKTANAITRIQELFDSEALSTHEKSMITHFRIDTESSNMINALGALLKYLDTVRIGVEYDALNVRTPISSIKTITIDEIVDMESGTYKALNIFGEHRQQEAGWRKAVYKDQSQATLFSLCNRCRSASGRNTLIKWFEHPTYNQEVLKKRQKAISFFIKDSNSELTSGIHHCLSKIRNMKTFIRKLSQNNAKAVHWKNLYETILSLSLIGEYLEDYKDDLEIISSEMKHFGGKLGTTAAVMAHICDFTESALEDRFVVRPGVDEDLDETKDIFEHLPTILTRAAHEESLRLGVKECTVVYVPMVGYLLSLPPDFQHAKHRDVRLVYSSADSIKLKTDTMMKLDEELGDIKLQIIDKESVIMLRLQKLLLEEATCLLAAARAAAIVDATIALAMTARHLGWHCPVLVKESIIDATGVIHPIVSITCEDGKFVPNPVCSGQQYSRVKIFTGPNACGKSIYLKQVGILVFLAHIGSFVPARRAVIGPFSSIFTRIHTVDSVLDGMSTFAKDLGQLAVSLRRGNEQSLVIMDEFGKGTMTEVGLSLLAASLNHFIDKGDECPHIFASSHFHSLSNFMDCSSPLLSFHTMETIRRGVELEFHYRLVDGKVDSSHAAHMALKMGIPSHIVARSVDVYGVLKKGKGINQVDVGAELRSTNKFLADNMKQLVDDFLVWNLDEEPYEFLDLVATKLLRDGEYLTDGVVHPSFSMDTTKLDSTSSTHIELNETSTDVGMKAAMPDNEDINKTPSPKSQLEEPDNEASKESLESRVTSGKLSTTVEETPNTSNSTVPLHTTTVAPFCVITSQDEVDLFDEDELDQNISALVEQTAMLTNRNSSKEHLLKRQKELLSAPRPRKKRRLF